MAKLRPRFGTWFGVRVIGFLAILPVLMVSSPRIYREAWVLFAMGAAVALRRCWRPRCPGFRRRLLLTFPGLLGVVLVLAGFVLGDEWLAQRREDARPLPPGNPPNVLFITLDTVRADHLSLYGYQRPTSPNLENLARSGIRFDEARAAAPGPFPHMQACSQAAGTTN